MIEGRPQIHNCPCARMTLPQTRQLGLVAFLVIAGKSWPQLPNVEPSTLQDAIDSGPDEPPQMGHLPYPLL